MEENGSQRNPIETVGVEEDEIKVVGVEKEDELDTDPKLCSLKMADGLELESPPMHCQSLPGSLTWIEAPTPSGKGAIDTSVRSWLRFYSKEDRLVG